MVVSQIEPDVSDVIEPASLTTMTIAEIDAHLEGVRTRRLQYVESLKRRSALSGSVREQEYQIAFDKVAARIKKKLDKIDADMEAVGLLVNKLRVLELEKS